MNPAIVYIVIPAFHPEAALLGRLQSLNYSSQRVVIVDDGSGAEFAHTLDELEKVSHVIRLPLNRGIATALNTGIAAAISNGATHILTLDQDSTIGQDYVQNALEFMIALQEDGHRVALVGAGRIDDEIPGGRPSPHDSVVVDEALQSGSLFDVATLTTLGTFEEALVIDGVDTEYTLRSAAKGYFAYLTPRCVISHNLGEPITVTSRGARVSFSYHAPIRRYYMTRNRAVLLARHGVRFRYWALHKTFDEVREYMLGLHHLPGRRQQVTAVALGLWDAMRHRSGKIPDAWTHSLSAPHLNR